MTYKYQKDAHKQVARAIKRGELIKPTSCIQCGQSGRIEGHHSDYEEPLKVIWLCGSCHHRLHPGPRHKGRWKKLPKERRISVGFELASIDFE